MTMEKRAQATHTLFESARKVPSVSESDSLLPESFVSELNANVKRVGLLKLIEEQASKTFKEKYMSGDKEKQQAVNK